LQVNQHALPRSGPILGLMAAVLFGISIPLAKLLLSEIQPVMLAGLFYFGSGLGLAICLTWQRRKKNASAKGQEHLTRTDIPWLTGAIAFGGILGPVLLMLGLARTAASTTSLLLNLEGVFTALVAWFVFHENFDNRILAGMAAITGGAAVLSWAGRPEFGVRGQCWRLVPPVAAGRLTTT